MPPQVSAMHAGPAPRVQPRTPPGTPPSSPPGPGAAARAGEAVGQPATLAPALPQWTGPAPAPAGTPDAGWLGGPHSALATPAATPTKPVVPPLIGGPLGGHGAPAPHGAPAAARPPPPHMHFDGRLGSPPPGWRAGTPARVLGSPAGGWSSNVMRRIDPSGGGGPGAPGPSAMHMQTGTGVEVLRVMSPKQYDEAMRRQDDGAGGEEGYVMM